MNQLKSRWEGGTAKKETASEECFDIFTANVGQEQCETFIGAAEV